MWRLPPSRSMVVYNAAIGGWADSGDPTAGGRAETLLNDIERRGVTPHSITYDAVINAYANGGHVNAATSAPQSGGRPSHAPSSLSSWAPPSKTKGCSPSW